MRRIAWLTACCALALAAGACSLRDPRPNSEAIDRAGRFALFPLYWVGGEFEGLALVAFARIVQPPSALERAYGARRTVDDVTLVYGTCDAEPDSGCAPPLAIMLSRVCDTFFAQDHLSPGPGPSVTHLRIAGVPAIWIGPGHRQLELYTGGMSITIFGARDLVLRAAAALRPANAAARALARPGRVLPALRPDSCQAA